MVADASQALGAPADNTRDGKRYRRVAEQLETLQQLTAVLASARTLQEIGDFVIDHVRPSLQAEVGVVAVLSDSGKALRNVGFKGVSDETVDAWLEYSLESPVPMAEAALRREPIVVTTIEERNRRYPVLAEVHGIDQGGAVICFPLLARGELVGALGFCFAQSRFFSDDDTRFFQALADQCALAVERALWYERAQQEINAREQFEQALIEADRRKDEFLATLAHELRNPLAPITQAVAIAKAAHATPAQKDWSHNVIQRQVRHMSLLLDDLLDVSRITSGKLKLRKTTTFLADVVDAAVETARPLIEGKKHILRIQLPPQPVEFVVDPLRIAQVLSNLLTNAAKYTDAPGKIELSAACTEAQVHLSVADTGLGLAPEALPNLFDMFSQVKSSRHGSEGLGIGLALARKLVELHGGTITVRSDGVGQGSEFTVSVPRGL